MSDEELEFPPVPLSPSLPSDFLDQEFVTKYENHAISENSHTGDPETDTDTLPKPVMSAARASFASKITRGSQSVLKNSNGHSVVSKPTGTTPAPVGATSNGGSNPVTKPDDSTAKLGSATKSGTSQLSQTTKPGVASSNSKATKLNPALIKPSATTRPLPAPDSSTRPKQIPKTRADLGLPQERKIADCKHRMATWIERARRKKHESDFANTERNHVLSILLAIDSLICFMVAFDYEDRADASRANSSEIGKPVHARSWQTLVPFLTKVAAKAEQVDSDLAGICYFVSGVVGLHVSYLQRRTTTPEVHTRDLYQALVDFRRALRLLPNDVIRTRYGMDHRSGWTTTQINTHRPDPVNNRATLPLHVNSSLPEAAAFALNVARKWASQEGVDYVWDAEQSA